MKKAANITAAAAAFVLIIDMLVMGLMIANDNYDGVTVCAYIAAAGLAVFIVGVVMKISANKCPHCGKVLVTSGSFCPYCGEKVEK